MSHYSDLIAAELNISPELAALAEEFIREDRTGLDHLTRDQLCTEAAAAVLDIAHWHTSGPVHGVTIADYCRSHGLPVPAEVA